MPNIKSAKKRVLIAKSKTIVNATIKSSLRTILKRFEEAIAKADLEDAKNRLDKAIKALDKAVTKGILHKNAAARKKSRLTKRLSALTSEKAS